MRPGYKSYNVVMRPEIVRKMDYIRDQEQRTNVVIMERAIKEYYDKRYNTVDIEESKGEE